MGKEEFYNANVQKLLKKHNINQHYSTYSIMKSSVVELYVEKGYMETIYAQWKL